VSCQSFPHVDSGCRRAAKMNKLSLLFNKPKGCSPPPTSPTSHSVGAVVALQWLATNGL
jgi:hypothetical protein